MNEKALILYSKKVIELGPESGIQADPNHLKEIKCKPAKTKKPILSEKIGHWPLISKHLIILSSSSPKS